MTLQFPSGIPDAELEAGPKPIVNPRTRQYYIVPMLVDIGDDYVKDNPTADKSKVKVTLTSHLIENCSGLIVSVKADEFFKYAKRAEATDLAEANIYKTYLQLLKQNKTELNWDEAQSAMLQGAHITRKEWSDRRAFICLYQRGTLEPHAPYYIYHTEDGYEMQVLVDDNMKETNDWVIVRVGN